MADMILRAALLERFAEMQKNDPEKDGRGFACHFLNDAREPSTEWYCVEDAVNSIPAVDAVPVCCKDCKYWSRPRELHGIKSGYCNNMRGKIAALLFTEDRKSVV